VLLQDLLRVLLGLFADTGVVQSGLVAANNVVLVLLVVAVASDGGRVDLARVTRLDVVQSPGLSAGNRTSVRIYLVSPALRFTRHLSF
jgi:hypothetical protein